MGKKFRQDIRHYLTSSGFISTLDAIRILVVAKLLGPYFAGLCATLMIIPQIAQYLNFGTIETLTVYVPQYRAKGMVEQASRLKNNVLTYTILVSVVSFLLVAVFASLVSTERPFVNQSMILAAILIISWELKQFFVTNYAVEGNFLRLSWVEFSFTFLVVIFQLITVCYSREYGFWLGLIAAGLLIIGFSARDYFKENKNWQPRLETAEIKKIFPMGLVMIMASVSYAPFMIVARIFLAGTIGVHEVGLFLLSVIVLSKLAVIPIAISKVALPHMSYIHGEKNDFRSVFELFAKAQGYTLGLSLLVVVIGYFTIQPAVAFILPQYLGGIAAAKMMLIAAIPYCLVDNANNVLLALQYKRTFMCNLAAALVLQAVSCLILYGLGHVTAWSVSTSLVCVFTCYAFFANYKVFQLRKQSVLAATDCVYAENCSSTI